MKELEKLRIWNQVKEYLGKIYDYKTRQIYYRALLARATNEFGFNPERPNDTKPNFEYLELDDWEKEFVEDINDSITFGFNVRKAKQSREFVETRRNMREFIRQAGTLKDIPEDIRTPHITNIYLQELLFEGDELLELADSILNIEGENK